MTEPREVPRRASPWGLPEGDHRQPKAHRCNDRAEDVIQVHCNFFLSISLNQAQPFLRTCNSCQWPRPVHLQLYLSKVYFLFRKKLMRLRFALIFMVEQTSFRVYNFERHKSWSMCIYKRFLDNKPREFMSSYFS